jgi:hypothetical protein
VGHIKWNNGSRKTPLRFNGAAVESNAQPAQFASVPDQERFEEAQPTYLTKGSPTPRDGPDGRPRARLALFGRNSSSICLSLDIRQEQGFNAFGRTQGLADLAALRPFSKLAGSIRVVTEPSVVASFLPYPRPACKGCIIYDTL